MSSFLLQPNRGLPPPPIYSDDEQSNVSNQHLLGSPSPKLLQKESSEICTNPNAILSTSELLTFFDCVNDEKILKKAKNRNHAINELISTEETYLNNLHKLMNIFCIPLANKPKILKTKHHKIIFNNNLESIIKLNTNLLSAIKANKQNIGQSMLQFIPFMKMYHEYVKNHEAASKLLITLRTESQFLSFLNSTKAQTNQTLESFLILPIQRTSRYELCLKQIIKLTEDTNMDKTNLIKCYDEICRVNQEINANLKEYADRQKVHQLSQQIGYSLVTPSRYYVFDGHLMKISRKKKIKYRFILFNDLLLYHDDSMKVHNTLTIDQYFGVERVCILDEQSVNKQHFQIKSLEKSFLCCAKSFKDREKWIDVIEECVEKIRKQNNLHIRHRRSMVDVNEGRILKNAPIYVSYDSTKECMMKDCGTKFGIFNKRNHCRYCGKLVCSECCLHSLPHFDPNKREKNKKVKVCDGCYNEHKVPHFLNVDQMHFVSSKLEKSKFKKGRKKSHSVNDIHSIQRTNENALDQIFGDFFDGDVNMSKTGDPFQDIWNDRSK